jgi:peptidoglycan/xylan/chitin deacetylase (PgdA/CDA1 family)
MFFAAILLTVLAAALAAKAAAVVRQQNRRPRALCLMYHRLAPQSECEKIQGVNRNYTVAVEDLEKQISYLKREGYRFLTADEARRLASGDWKLDRPAVLVTFDDGCVSVFESALPVFERHKVPAMVFVTTNPAAYVFGYGQRRMSDEELRAVEAAGIQCESHGVTHRPLVQLSDEEVRKELRGSKIELEAILGRAVKFLSAPGNWFDARISRLAKEAGYEAMWISEPGSMQPGSNVFGLTRLNVDGTLTLEQFASLLTPWGVAQRALVYKGKMLPKKLAGPKLWLALRSRLLPLLPGGYVSFARWRMILTVPVIVVALVVLFRTLNG